MASEVGVLDIDPATVVQKGRLQPGPHVPRRHRPGPHRRRRRDQGRPGRRAPLRRVARRQPGPPRRPARRGTTRCTRTASVVAAPAGVRLHHRGAQDPARARWPAPAPSRSARWAPTRRSPCCRTGPGCCSTTSRSCSPRSPTRRSTPSARSWSPRSAARSAPRATCSTRRRRRAARSSAAPDHQQRRAGQAPLHQRGRRLARLHARRHRGLYPVAEGGDGPARARSTTSAARRQRRHRRRRQHPRPVRPRLRPPSWRRSRRCCSPRAVHHHLIREKTRTQVGLVVETGEAREVHHMALLLGYGAARHQPVPGLRDDRGPDRRGRSPSIDPARPSRNYIKACGKGVLKVMSKMGISTVASYTGAQVFEAIGLGPGPRRRVLHRHRQPPRRHRPRRAGRRGRRRATAWPTPTGPRSWPTATSRSAASTSGAARASTTSSTPRPCSSCSTPPAPSATTSSRSTPQLVDDQSAQLATLRGLFRFRDRRAPADPDRRGRAGQRDRQALLHRRHDATARSRPRPTRRWPSP